MARWLRCKFAMEANTTSHSEHELLIVIVNYRTPELAVDCLRSLEHEVRAVGAAHVVIVDGGSGDHSAAYIESAIDKRGYGAWASAIPLSINRGFAYANNAAIAPALRAPSLLRTDGR